MIPGDVAMIGLLLAALSAAPTTIDVERAYAALAQTKGQWTAFRATAAPDALMFVPEPVQAAQWLSERRDPAVSVMWWPSRGWISCDGRLGINFGPWVRRGGHLLGTFTTIWAKQPDGDWKWQLDLGGVSPRAVAAGDSVTAMPASCRNLPAARGARMEEEDADRDPLVILGDTGPRADLPAAERGRKGTILKAGRSPDGSLAWEVIRPEGGGAADAVLRAWRWDGRRYRLILFERTGPGS
jgi:hypothetical protein